MLNVAEFNLPVLLVVLLLGVAAGRWIVRGPAQHDTREDEGSS